MKFLENSLSAPFACPSLGWGFSGLEGRFLWRNVVEVNSDIVETLQQGTRDEEVIDAIVKGRQHAMDEVNKLNNQFVEWMDDSNFLRLEDNHRLGMFDSRKEKIETRVRKRLRRVLEGKTADGGNKSINFAKDRDNYESLLKNILDGSGEAIKTVGDIDFALATARTVLSSFESRLETEKNQTRKRMGINPKSWFYGKDLLGRFNTRGETVKKTINDCISRLEDELGSQKGFLKKVSEKAREEVKYLTPDKQQKLIGLVAEEISGTRKDRDLDSEGLLASPLNSLPFEQRLELYKELGWDQSGIDLNLKNVARDRETFKEQVNTSREYDKELEAALTSKFIGNLKKKLKWDDRIKSSDIESHSDLSGLVQELKDFTERFGTNSQNEIFKDFHKRESLTTAQTLLIYLKYLGGKEEGDMKLLSRSLRIRVLGYVQYLEEKEGIQEDEKESFSEGFHDLEKKAIERFKKGEKVLGDLNGDNTIGDLDKHCKDIDGFIADNKRYEQEVAIKTKLSQKEKDTLAEYQEKLDRLNSDLEDVKGKWEEEVREFEERESHYTYWKKQLDDIDKHYKEYSADEIKKSIVRGEKSIPQKDRDPIKEEIVLDRTGAEQLSKKNDLRFSRLQEFESELKRYNGKAPENKEKAKTKIQTSWLHDIKKDHLTVETKSKSRPKSADSLVYARVIRNLLEQSAKEQNEDLDKRLKQSQKNMLENLRKKNKGSTLNISYLEYKHAAAPTLKELLDESPKIVNNCQVLMQSDSGTILFNRSTSPHSLIVIQEGKESKNVEVISMPVPGGYDIGKDGIPKDFQLGQTQNWVATPTSILPA